VLRWEAVAGGQLGVILKTSGRPQRVVRDERKMQNVTSCRRTGPLFFGGSLTKRKFDSKSPAGHSIPRDAATFSAASTQTRRDSRLQLRNGDRGRFCDPIRRLCRPERGGTTGHVYFSLLQPFCIREMLPHFGQHVRRPLLKIGIIPVLRIL
jgi:hypothetical protein